MKLVLKMVANGKKHPKKQLQTFEVGRAQAGDAIQSPWGPGGPVHFMHGYWLVYIYIYERSWYMDIQIEI